MNACDKDTYEESMSTELDRHLFIYLFIYLFFIFFLQNITYYTKLKLFTTEYLQYGTYATRYYYYIRYYYSLARGTNVNNAYKIYETF